MGSRARGTWFAGALVALAVCLLSVCAPQARADDVLRFRASCLGGRMYDYWRFSNAARVIQPGDCVEYDVYVSDNRSGIGGIDIYNTDGTYWRDQAGWADQNGLPGHPAGGIQSLAYRKWYHRRLPVPPSMVGKTTSIWDLAIDGSYDWWELPSAMYNNVCITNGGSVVTWAYTDGSPSLNQLHFDNGNAAAAFMFPTSTRRGPVRLSAHLFYWYDAPLYADPTQMVYDPYGLSSNGPWTGYGYGSGFSGYYSSQNSGWWERVFSDMKSAGVDVADLVCWGNNSPWFGFDELSNYMVPALQRSGSDIKIALFDDTSSEVCEWNLANGRGYSMSPAMPLSYSPNWAYFYDAKILPFYQSIPQQYWATHNGLPVAQGGRPIIITYSAGFFSDVAGYGTAMWDAIKGAFQRDFGVTPFVIHEVSWYNANATHCSADSYYAWGSALNGPNGGSVNGWYTATIGPGYDDRIIRSPGSYRDRGYGSVMKSWYNQAVAGRQLWDCNLVVVETWNELWEGTGIERCPNYPDQWGGYNETQYMDALRDCVESSIGRRDLDATFLYTWQIPATVTRGSTVVSTRIRNDGLLGWTSAPVYMYVYLEDLNGQQVPNTVYWYPLPSAAYLGDEVTVNWTAPAGWPTGNYNLRFDMVWDGWTAFYGQGDGIGKKAITIN